MTLLTEAVEKLIMTDTQYVRDAVLDSADRFQSMSDRGSDSLYSEPARRWRILGTRIETLQTDSEANQNDILSEDDYQMIAAGILWYELNCNS